MQALEGTKVLDFTRNAPGMFCTMILGDMGADVLMVERPIAGQRAAGGLSSAEEDQKRAAYNALQRNKESIAREQKIRELEAPGSSAGTRDSPTKSPHLFDIECPAIGVSASDPC